jgi:NAD(P)-dependent dehydrogenase (short-subunit alcohol dehydrogenase family)
MGSLEGQLAIVTGGGGGIGAAVVRAMAAEGPGGRARHQPERAQGVADEVGGSSFR